MLCEGMFSKGKESGEKEFEVRVFETCVRIRNLAEEG